MNTKGMFRLFVDWYLLIFLLQVPVLCVAGFVDHPGLSLVMGAAIALMVSALVPAMGTARIYSISNSHYRVCQMVTAGLMGLAFVLALLPGALISGSPTIYYGIAGALVGVVVQWQRHPERRFTQATPWTLATGSATSLPWDIIWRRSLVWALVGPGFIVLAFFFRHYGLLVESSGLFGGMIGAMGAMLGGTPIVLRTQLSTWSSYGRNTNRFLFHVRWAYRAIALSWGFGIVFAFVIADGTIRWQKIALACAFALFLEAALIGLAFRRSKYLAPIVTFILMMVYCITMGLDYATPVVLVILGVQAVVWMYLMYFRVPRTLRRRTFATSGFRNISAQEQRVAI